MTLATQLGVFLRRLSSATNAKAVRSEDQIRASHLGGPVTERVEQIRKEALEAESELS